MKFEFIYRDCNIEIDNDDDDHEDELMVHYKKFHHKLNNRCRNCMQKLYNGYHFRDSCIDKRTGHKSIVHSYIDYTDISNSVSDDKDDVDD